MLKMDDVLKAFAPHRGDAIVISGRATRQWEKISTQRELDLPLGDPAMGGHASFALGLALAQPHRKVVLFDSEGDIQMNLGVLAMIAEQKPKNFYHLLLTTSATPPPAASRCPTPRRWRTTPLPKAAVIRRRTPLPTSNHSRFPSAASCRSRGR